MNNESASNINNMNKISSDWFINDKQLFEKAVSKNGAIAVGWLV